MKKRFPVLAPRLVMIAGFAVMLASIAGLILAGLARLADIARRLSDLERFSNLQALTQASAEARNAYLLLAGFGAGLFVVSLLVAWAVIRRADRAEAALYREKERAEVTLHAIAEGVIATDAVGRVEYLNAAAEELTGWRGEEARGLPLEIVYRAFEEETRKPVERRDEAAGEQEKARIRSIVLMHRDGREIPVEEACAPIRDRSGRIAGLVVVFHDVSRLRAIAQRLTWQASHDALTGLTNRREFERRLAQLLETAKSTDKRHALLYLDLDRFKAVNDSCGHIAGDELLRQLAGQMQLQIRGSDTLGRLGGDEFGVLLEACPLGQALRIANGLRETVRDFRFPWKDKVYTVGASIGLVVIDSASGSVADVLEAADTSCYAAKKKGGSRVQVYRPAEGEPAAHGDTALVHQIARALESGGFRLYRQRIAPVAGEAGSGHYEILVRMVDEAGNLLAPTDFIPAAERFNLLPMVDRWVVSTLLDVIGQGKGMGEEGSFYSVNLSGASINDSTFTDFLRRQLNLHRVPSERLCFEVTETTAISNLTRAAELMHELKAIGCRFALDDFGVGMSSFAYLKHLPVDFLKIDGTFVRDMATNLIDYAIVDAINRIGHLLGMRTVAEFVADRVTLEKLKELKVDYAQGEAVGVPEPLFYRPGAAAAAG